MKNLRKQMKSLLEKLNVRPGQQWILLLLSAGLGMYLISGSLMGDSEEKVPLQQTAQVQIQKPELEQRLTECLQKVRGVGRVEVVLSLAQQQTTVYQTDEDQTDSETSQTFRKSTVIVSGEGLVQTVYAPEYRGAIVVCEGADRASVVQAVKAAVSSLTGLKSDQITVMKMK